jgi:hypothetical protein
MYCDYAIGLKLMRLVMHDVFFQQLWCIVYSNVFANCGAKRATETVMPIRDRLKCSLAQLCTIEMLLYG